MLVIYATLCRSSLPLGKGKVILLQAYGAQMVLGG
jgi:hypothetical protein